MKAAPGAEGPRPGAGPRGAVAAFRLAGRAAPLTLALYTVLVLAAGVLPVAVALLTKILLDRLASAGATGSLAGPGSGLVAAGLLMGALPQVTQYLRAQLDRRSGLLAQERLFTAVEGFTGLGRFEDPRFIDRMRIARQVGGTSPNQAIDGILGAGRAVLTVSGFIGALAVVNTPLTVLMVVAGIPTVVAEVALSRRRARMFWEVGPVERREFFYSDLLSRVAAAKEVRLFGTGPFLRERMLKERRTADAARRSMDRREVGVQGGLSLLSAVLSGTGLLWAINSARHGAFSVGDVTMFVAGIAGVQGGLASLAGEIARLHQALTMFGHYLAVTGTGPDLPQPAEPLPLPALRRGIELRDVWFRYSEEHPWILRGVDLWIPHGTALALVGLNGAGKSTLVKLLCRFYDPTRGAVLWDGVDLREVAPADLRRRIGAVFQDYMEYDLSAGENIALGDLGALDDPERIRTAAERAGIHEKLTELPHGYETLLSREFFSEVDKEDPETGVVLSGGQWQRLALARAFLRDGRDLMILDEPSAGLDAESEHEIHTSLRRHRGGRTSLLISHRLGAVRDADLIVVLAEGRIAEQGDHAQLVAAEGRYARLFSLQAAGYQHQTVDHEDADDSTVPMMPIGGPR
ncbi:ABC transporter ATP-binding protein [Streptomyces sp. NPDC058401]|uniref:ABC transporter ATP-binding protein n=1 Tax=Streptomyces sp. NPDC058401 TaxID=3346480 RepID=UPI003653908B